MKKRWWLWGLILLFVVNLTALMTFSYHRWIRGRDVRQEAAENPVAGAARQMCLSGEQKDCLKTLRGCFDSEIQGVQSRLNEKKKLLVEEMKKESPDGPRLDRLIDETSRLQAEIQKKAVAHLLKEKDVLTPGQREIFFRSMEKHICPLGKETGRPSGGADAEKCPPGKTAIHQQSEE